MVTRANNFAGGTEGTAITPANSGGLSGDAFDSVNGSVITYSSAQSYQSRFSGTIVDAAAENSWVYSGLGTITSTTWFGLWLYMTAFPTTNRAYIGRLFTAAAGAAAFLRIFNSTGIVSMADSGVGGFGAEGAVAVALNQWVRIEWMVTPGAGTGQAQWWLYNNADSSTETETSGLKTGLTLGANIDAARFGLTTSPFPAAPYTIRFGQLALSTVDKIGPFPRTAIAYDHAVQIG